MTGNIGKLHPFAEILSDYLSRTETVNKASLARRIGKDESTLRTWLTRNTSPSVDALIEIAPLLPDDVLLAILIRMGAGKYLPEPVADVAELSDTVIAEAIQFAEKASRLPSVVYAAASDNFMGRDEAAGIQRFIGELGRLKNRLAAHVQAIEGRSLPRRIA